MLGDSSRETRGAWKNAQYGALLGVAMRLASRATRCDSLQLQRAIQRPHLPWTESLARLSNTHGRVATRPPTAYAKNANRALPWSRKSTGLTGHGDS